MSEVKGTATFSYFEMNASYLRASCVCVRARALTRFIAYVLQHNEPQGSPRLPPCAGMGGGGGGRRGAGAGEQKQQH